MYLIQAHTHYRWISGIFQAKTTLDTYLQTIPIEQRSFHQVFEYPEQTYPLRLIENSEGFRPVTENELNHELQSLHRQEDEDHVYLNIYTITEDYTPPEPGIDWMGSLSHIHVNNEYLHN